MNSFTVMGQRCCWAICKTQERSSARVWNFSLTFSLYSLTMVTHHFSSDCVLPQWLIAACQPSIPSPTQTMIFNYLGHQALQQLYHQTTSPPAVLLLLVRWLQIECRECRGSNPRILPAKLLYKSGGWWRRRTKMMRCRLVYVKVVVVHIVGGVRDGIWGWCFEDVLPSTSPEKQQNLCISHIEIGPDCYKQHAFLYTVRSKMYCKACTCVKP